MKDVTVLYFRAIGLSVEGRAPDYSLLNELYQRHCSTFSFNSLCINFKAERRRSTEMSPDMLLDELLKYRSGSCFHHNYAFVMALRALGFVAQLLESHVYRLDDVTNKTTYSMPTHCVVLVTIGNKQIIADPGWSVEIKRPLVIGGSDGRFMVERQENGVILMSQRGADGSRRAWYEIRDFVDCDITSFSPALYYTSTDQYPFSSMVEIALFNDGDPQVAILHSDRVSFHAATGNHKYFWEDLLSGDALKQRFLPFIDSLSTGPEASLLHVGEGVYSGQIQAIVQRLQQIAQCVQSDALVPSRLP